MKAWRISRHGGPDVLQYADVPTPTAGPMQVRVQVEAVALNHLDLWVRNGVPGHRFPLPMTPGCDIAGRIEQVGPGAERVLSSLGLKPGDPVLVNPGVSCGACEACLSGFDPLCRNYGILGEHLDGGAAEFAVVPAANLVARHDLGAVEAASLPIPFVTAWSMLTRKVQLRPGETVLIQAGGSGVSIAAIQIAKMMGAQVITTVGSDDKIAKARDLGADHVINYRKTPFRDELKKILTLHGKKGVEVVVDHVGEETFSDSFKSLAWGGRLVSCGATSGSRAEFDLKALFFKNLSVLGSTMGSKSDLIRIVELVRTGKLRPVIDSVFTMAEYVNACAKLESRQVFGKIVVKN